MFPYLFFCVWVCFGLPWVCYCGNYWLEHDPGSRPNIMSHSFMSTETEREAIVYVCVLGRDYRLCHSPDHGTHTEIYAHLNTHSWNETLVLVQHSSSSISHTEPFFLLSISVSLPLSFIHLQTFHTHRPDSFLEIWFHYRKP